MNREKRLQVGLVNRHELQATGTKFTQISGLPGLGEFSEFYYLTDDGQVWSDYLGDYLSPAATNADGYHQVGLMRKDGSRKTLYIHQLIAVMKVGRTPTNGEEVRHLDGDKHNNRAENIDLGPRDLNVNDRIRRGRSGQRYSEAQIRHTRSFGPLIGKSAKERHKGLSKAKLMARSGVASSAMDSIIQRKQRADVPEIPQGCEGIILNLDSATEVVWTSDHEEVGPPVFLAEVLEAIKQDHHDVWVKLKEELQADQH